MDTSNATTKRRKKRCERCKGKYPADDRHFFSCSVAADGLFPICKSCFEAGRFMPWQIAKLKARLREDGIRFLASPLIAPEPINIEQVRDIWGGEIDVEEGAVVVDAKARIYRAFGKDISLSEIRGVSVRSERLKALASGFAYENWLFALKYFDGRCAACGRTPDSRYILAKDHWIPVSDIRSGNPGTVPWNIVPLCHLRKSSGYSRTGCNNSKGKRNPLEWLTERFGEHDATQIDARVQAFFAICRKIEMED